MSTAEELQAKIDKLSVELDKLREEFIAENARRSGIHLDADIQNEDSYEDALRTRIEEDERKDYRDFAENLKRSIEEDKSTNTKKMRKNGGLGRKHGRKLGRGLTRKLGRKLGRGLSQRQRKRSRQSRR